MNTIRAAVLIGLTLLLGACAHPIVISPDPASLPKQSTKIDRKLGLLMTAENRQKEVITPGGGGDKLSYHPYSDLEFGLYSTLSVIFPKVTLLNSTTEKEKITQQGVQLIFVPDIQTMSSSDSALTWPPTSFQVVINYQLLNPDGTQLTSGVVSGEGNATFSEFKSDFNLAAKRAGATALIKLKDNLLNKPELNQK